MTVSPQSDNPNDQPEEIKTGIRSLKELIDLVTGKDDQFREAGGDAGLAEPLPFPFLALVGQREMKLALILTLINPNIGGALLIGPRGTGKTTAVRSLLDLLPQVAHSTCFYGCLPEDVEAGGIDAVCPDCARKFAEGQPLSVEDQVRLVELPLNSALEDVIGALDERALVHERLRLRRGILGHADRNILYVDEANLLANEIVDAILDAAAQGSYTVRRGASSATYRSRFTLIGSMNPEEGRLRPQIMDRFGLRILVRGLDDPADRLEAYRRVQAYLANPRQTTARYAEGTTLAREEIQAARQNLSSIHLPDSIAALGIVLIQNLKIDSLRADITLFEAARALAAADNRVEVSIEDLKTIAPMALRMRRSQYMRDYVHQQAEEEQEIQAVFDEVAA
ncbi:MAG TPA: ATP-binding protein [Anaerolineaceae bacterium]|nr:ATP-binding protein [Anaerolineaceae bacterium]